MTAQAQRKFIRGCLIVATVALLGGLGYTYGLTRTDMKTFDADKTAEAALERERSSRASRAPRYLELERSGELKQREEAIWAKMESCDLCPRECRVNRLAGETGICGVADNFKVASFGPHPGEERPLVGTQGSGTIFFSNCNLLCAFCQNWEINHRGDGQQINHERLAQIMLTLQRSGCHNINLVTPTHLMPHIMRALRIAIAGGLNLPLVYNSGGYDSYELLKLLDGVVDIYLPDFKYMDAELAARFSEGAPDVPYHTKIAIKEMHRQVGTLKLYRGVAYRGLLIRHLVLPENAAATDEFVRWFASELGTETHVNIMGQYRPAFRANEFPPLNRRVTQAELNQAMRWAREAGLHNFH